MLKSLPLVLLLTGVCVAQDVSSADVARTTSESEAAQKKTTKAPEVSLGEIARQLRSRKQSGETPASAEQSVPPSNSETPNTPEETEPKKTAKSPDTPAAEAAATGAGKTSAEKPAVKAPEISLGDYARQNRARKVAAQQEEAKAKGVAEGATAGESHANDASEKIAIKPETPVAIKPVKEGASKQTAENSPKPPAAPPAQIVEHSQPEKRVEQKRGITPPPVVAVTPSSPENADKTPKSIAPSSTAPMQAAQGLPQGRVEETITVTPDDAAVETTQAQSSASKATEDKPIKPRAVALVQPAGTAQAAKALERGAAKPAVISTGEAGAQTSTVKLASKRSISTSVVPASVVVPRAESTPPAKITETIPAHFLTIGGQAGPGEFGVRINGETIFHNSYVHDLPLYISPVLQDGENTLEVLFVNGSEPLTIMIEERVPGAKDRKLLANFRAGPYEYLSPTLKEIKFTAHPKPLPPLDLTDTDRAEIQDLVQVFYDTLAMKNSKLVMNLFEPAIEDARGLYPEGAAFGRSQMEKMAGLVTRPGFAMQPFDALGHLELVPNGATVIVRRTDGRPLFSSNDVTLPNGNTTTVSAETVPVKKLKGQWCVTLPFGF